MAHPRRGVNRPPIQRDARRRVVPGPARIREAGSGLPDGLADREIKAVHGQVSMSLAHPDLQQARVDINQRTSAKPIDERRRGEVLEVQQQLCIQGRIDTRESDLGQIGQWLAGPRPRAPGRGTDRTAPGVLSATGRRIRTVTATRSNSGRPPPARSRETRANERRAPS